MRNFCKKTEGFTIKDAVWRFSAAPDHGTLNHAVLLHFVATRIAFLRVAGLIYEHGRTG
jgi:hypothetical protein